MTVIPYKELAWEPSAALVTKSYSCRLHWETKLSLFNLESQNQAKNVPVGLELPNQNLRQMVQGFLSYDRTNKRTDRQTNRDYNFIYIKYIKDQYR